MEPQGLKQLNELSLEQAIEQFRRCCGTERWCRVMATARPFSNVESLHRTADDIMDDLTDEEWLEAFACHPQIGDLNSLRMKYAGNREWSAGEQAGVKAADEQVVHELAAGNTAYKAKFGFIFIVCATGKSAAEMLDGLRSRLPLSYAEELVNASREQRKITHLRIDKMEIS